jgi:signal transduction histidine kinase
MVDDILRDIEFVDIFDLELIQDLQDSFAQATGVASLITKPDGTPITKPSNFCRLCKLIRKTDKGLKNCYASDAMVGRQNKSGPIYQKCLSGGLWDAGASISVGEKHIGNWLIGQIKNNDSDEMEMLKYAKEIGIDEAVFTKALSEVTVMPLNQFKKISDSLFIFANQLSEKAYQNIQLKQYQEHLELLVKEKTEKLEIINRKLESTNNKLEESRDRLMELNRAKDKFFRIIGHDLKGPIGQMIQFSELIEENYKELSEEKLLPFIKAMRESSIRSFKLLENLLDWARSQTGSISFKQVSFSMADLIRDNVDLLIRQAEVKEITIDIIGLDERFVSADKNMLNTVIRNLITNAIKFTKTGGRIEIQSQKFKNKYFVSVKDNGVGLSSEDKGQLFRLDSGYTTLGTNNEKGTGIGLILCKEFVERHKGKIWVESTLGEGSVFMFTIPG